MSDEKQTSVALYLTERMIRADANLAIARVAIEQALKETLERSDTPDLISLRGELAALRGELTELSDRVGRSTISAARIRHGVTR